MTLGEILKYCNYVMNRDQLGDPVDPEEFNVLLSVVNIEKFNLDWKKLVQVMNASNEAGKTGDNDMDHLLYEMTSLHRFLVFNEYGIYKFAAPLPADYRRVWRVQVLYEDEDLWRKAEIISNPNELNSSSQDFLSKVSREHPIAYIMYDPDYFAYEGYGIYGIPQDDCDRLRVWHLRNPKDAYYDYCVTETDLFLYMPPGSQVKTDNKLYDSGNNVLEENVSVPHGSLPYTSKSVELDWDIDEHVEFANLIIEKMSVYNREEKMTQFSQLKKQE